MNTCFFTALERWIQLRDVICKLLMRRLTRHALMFVLCSSIYAGFGPPTVDSFFARAQGSPTPVQTRPSPLTADSAERDANGQPLESNKVTQAPTEESGRGYLSGFEFNLTLIVSGIALVALLMEFFLLRRTEKLRSEDILRVFGVTLIIFGTLFFVSVGYDANQVAPAIGLFGTVAGYLLGRSTRRNDQADKD